MVLVALWNLREGFCFLGLGFPGWGWDTFAAVKKIWHFGQSGLYFYGMWGVLGVCGGEGVAGDGGNKKTEIE